MEFAKMNPKQLIKKLDKFDDENEEDVQKAIEIVEDYTDVNINDWALLSYFENKGVASRDGVLDVLNDILNNGEISQHDEGSVAIPLDMNDVKETYKHVKNSPVEYWNVRESYILCDAISSIDLVEAIDYLFELDE